MAFDPFTAAFDLANSIVVRLFPDADAAGRRELEAMLAQLAASHKTTMGQLEVNKVEAAHRNLFVAGWRPLVGWICASALAYAALVYPLLVGTGLDLPPPTFVEDHVTKILYAMLGLGAARTVEKLTGKAK